MTFANVVREFQERYQTLMLNADNQSDVWAATCTDNTGITFRAGVMATLVIIVTPGEVVVLENQQGMNWFAGDQIGPKRCWQRHSLLNGREKWFGKICHRRFCAFEIRQI